MAAHATPKYDVVVKGDPEKNKLTDCPFCHRVLLTLETKGIPYGMTYVDFDKKPDWLMEQSGGKVPVLRAEGMVMPDSDAITAYLEKEYPQPSMASHEDPSVGAKLFPSFRAFLTSKAGDADEGDKRAALEAELRTVENALSQPGKGPFFGGTALNATDAALAPRLYHIDVALPHFKKWSIPAEFKAIRTYLDTIKQLPAWQKVDYGEQAIIDGWKKHMAH